MPDQFAATQETCVHIAGMIEHGWDVIITHGNGPQVGFILRRSELASHVLHTVPLDSCGADTQGAIGYMIQQSLYNEFKLRGINKQAVTVVTQVLVDKDDPAFQNPSKPIGPFLDGETALKRQDEEGWDVIEDAGRGWRRVVPSPIPRRIIERDAVKNLIDAGFVVIAVGGGWIPVVEEKGGPRYQPQEHRASVGGRNGGAHRALIDFPPIMCYIGIVTVKEERVYPSIWQGVVSQRISKISAPYSRFVSPLMLHHGLMWSYPLDSILLDQQPSKEVPMIFA